MKIIRGQKGEQRPLPPPNTATPRKPRAGKKVTFSRATRPAASSIIPFIIIVFYDIVLGQRLRLPR